MTSTRTARIAILGATAYTARELFTILARHPQAHVTCATSRNPDARSVADAHPSLLGVVDLPLTARDPADIVKTADFAFSCLPHAASAGAIAPLLDASLPAVDLSADYRLGDPYTYRTWYGIDHPDPSRLGHVPYALPELFRNQIVGAHIVANPGCYPTASLLALAPLVRDGLIAHDPVIIDAKSGISGAGRTPTDQTHFVEANESVTPYAIARHRHTPEIARVLGLLAGKDDLPLSFVPHLVPMSRGLCATCYARPIGNIDDARLTACLSSAYADEPLVRVVDNPSTRHVVGTPFCDVSARRAGAYIVTIAVIDNLLKGASATAVQNMNLMLGFDETLGLLP